MLGCVNHSRDLVNLTNMFLETDLIDNYQTMELLVFCFQGKNCQLFVGFLSCRCYWLCKRTDSLHEKDTAWEKCTFNDYSTEMLIMFLPINHLRYTASHVTLKSVAFLNLKNTRKRKNFATAKSQPRGTRQFISLHLLILKLFFNGVNSQLVYFGFSEQLVIR